MLTLLSQLPLLTVLSLLFHLPSLIILGMGLSMEISINSCSPDSHHYCMGLSIEMDIFGILASVWFHHYDEGYLQKCRKLCLPLDPIPNPIPNLYRYVPVEVGDRVGDRV